jgi:pimeloyl-ACP methyl ester carboxylesterase
VLRSIPHFTLTLFAVTFYFGSFVRIRKDKCMTRSGRVTTEGDELCYEVRGDGAPLLLIPGGGGDGGAYYLIAEILSDEFKVITYDRRANARSTMHFPHHFDISQQSRDAVAVIGAAGESAAHIFGNSSGAVIALDMAASQPQAVRTVVAHEPPLALVHPDAKQWEMFFKNVYRTGQRFGPTLAMLRFAFGIGVDSSFRGAFKAAKAMRKYRQESGQQYLSRKVLMEYFVFQELLPVTSYQPDIETIKKNAVRVVMAAGERSLQKKRFYAETAEVLAQKIGCEMVKFPGSHASFVDMPHEWATTLRNILKRVA